MAVSVRKSFNTNTNTNSFLLILHTFISSTDCQSDLSASITKLNSKSKLFVLREAPQTVLVKLFKAWKISHLVFEKDTDAYARERDQHVLEQAKEAGVEVIVKMGRTLYDPDELVKANGKKPTMSIAQVQHVQGTAIFSSRESILMFFRPQRSWVKSQNQSRALHLYPTLEIPLSISSILNPPRSQTSTTSSVTTKKHPITTLLGQTETLQSQHLLSLVLNPPKASTVAARHLLSALLMRSYQMQPTPQPFQSQIPPLLHSTLSRQPCSPHPTILLARNGRTQRLPKIQTEHHSDKSNRPTAFPRHVFRSSSSSRLFLRANVRQQPLQIHTLASSLQN